MFVHFFPIDNGYLQLELIIVNIYCFYFLVAVTYALANDKIGINAIVIIGDMQSVLKGTLVMWASVKNTKSI